MVAHVSSIFALGRLRWAIFERVVFGLCGIIFCLALYSVGSDRLWVGAIPALTDGLTPIGTVNLVKGTARRRTEIDSLWLPLAERAPIFNGDLISTGEAVTAEISLGVGISFSIQPDSLARLRISDGKPLVRLTQGTVKVDTTSDQTLLIQYGARVKEVTVRKGSFLIKNDTAFGIQITSFTQQTEVAQGYEADRRKKARAAEDSPTDDAPAEAKPAPAAKSEVEPTLEAATDLPVPKDGTVFLVRAARAIIVGAKPTCPDVCSLKIAKDTVMWREKDFRAGEETTMRIEAGDVKNGVYDWQFSTQTSEHHASFSIHAFSNEELAKAIEHELPVEIQ